MDKTFGELIQEALTELGWSKAELARRADFSATHIGNLIRDYSPGTKSGKPTRLPIETVDRIADALNRPRTPFRRAAGLLPEGAETNNTREAEATRAAEMMDVFLRLPPDDQARALAMVKILGGQIVIRPESAEDLKQLLNDGKPLVKETKNQN